MALLAAATGVSSGTAGGTGGDDAVAGDVDVADALLRVVVDVDAGVVPGVAYATGPAVVVGIVRGTSGSR